MLCFRGRSCCRWVLLMPALIFAVYTQFHLIHRNIFQKFILPRPLINNRSFLVPDPISPKFHLSSPIFASALVQIFGNFNYPWWAAKLHLFQKTVIRFYFIKNYPGIFKFPQNFCERTWGPTGYIEIYMQLMN